MLLAMDVGNTNTVIGIYENDQLINHWRLETKKERTADEYGIFFKELFSFSNIKLSDVKHIIISNVVPPLEFALMRMSDRYFNIKPYIVKHSSKMPIKIGLKNPDEIGADRLVNAVGAIQKYDGPLIIVDFGTATTFDYINKNKVYKGGCICPGIAISNEALFQRASKLPRVEIAKPKKVIGNTTLSSIQSGIYYGYVGLVDEIVNRIQNEAKNKCTVIATGGFTGLISKESKTIKHVESFLTLDGLLTLFLYQQKKPLKKKSQP